MQVYVSYTDPTFKTPKSQEINIVKSGNFQYGFKNQEKPAFKSYIMKRDQEKLSIPIDIGHEYVYFLIQIFEDPDDTYNEEQDKLIHKLKIVVNFGLNNFNKII